MLAITKSVHGTHGIETNPQVVENKRYHRKAPTVGVGNKGKKQAMPEGRPGLGPASPEGIQMETKYML